MANMVLWISGQTLDPWPVQLNQPPDQNGNIVPSNLTNATLSLILQRKGNGQDVIGAGQFTITDPINGLATYFPVPADSAIVGGYRILVKATFPPVGGVPQIKYWSLGSLTIQTA